MSNMKKHLALLLCLLLCLSLLPAAAFAEEENASETDNGDVVVEEDVLTEDGTDGILADTANEPEEIVVEEDVLAEDGTDDVLTETANEPEENTERLDSAPDSSEQVEGFVRRSYRVILGREADQGGLDYWVKGLRDKTFKGGDIVSQFMNSDEYVLANHPNADAVTAIYRTMLDREPDAGGQAYWVGLLDKGCSYNLIIKGFCDSAEFKGICDQYGIEPGTVATERRDENPDVTAFVNRNYLYALLRKGEPQGLNGWTDILLSGAQTAQQVAHGFVFSEECTGRGLNNRQFVEMLYPLYMGRDPDEAGLSYWVTAMDSGTSREQIVKSFGGSEEFRQIVMSYGLPVQEPEKPWNPDIAFTTKDMYGNEYTDRLFANADITMLNLWAYWCGPCINELKDLQKLQNNYASRGLQIFGVSFQDYNAGNIQEFERQGITYPSLIATAGLVYALQTGSVPTTIFVNREGRIVSEQYVGSRDYNGWASIVEGYLG